MKKISYKTDKWEKRKVILVKNSKYDYEEVDLLKEDYMNGVIDEIRYHYTLSLYLNNIAENEFVMENHSECLKRIKESLNEFAIAVKLLQEGNTTNQATLFNISNKLKSAYFGYFAIIMSDYDVIPQITDETSNINKMLSTTIDNIDENNTIAIMEKAISLRDSDKFEQALMDRIKEIRKFNVDNYICADFISIALIKAAKKVGMCFEAEYIEVDLKEN